MIGPTPTALVKTRWTGSRGGLAGKAGTAVDMTQGTGVNGSRGNVPSFLNNAVDHINLAFTGGAHQCCNDGMFPNHRHG
jgi:hypothetical protein